MTSFFTTGGIRGGKRQLDKKFYPRSFNLGVRREVYNQLGGFSTERFSKMSLYGEDIDFSIRIYKDGFSCRLFPDAWLWHKRRTDFRRFWRQVYNSGYARVNLGRKYPEALKAVHILPALFTVGVIVLLCCWLTGEILFFSGISLGLYMSLFSLLPLVLFSAIIFIDSSIRNRSIRVGLLSVPAAFIQLIGYGIGFIESSMSKRHG
jgi:GT2 family glycosyltransferase